jgi:hypothetical protein
MKFSILLLLVLASCATPYQSSGYRGGFSEQMLAKDLYEVSFSGNGFTSQSTVANYLNRRCAELAVQNGFTHFVVVETSDGTSIDTMYINNRPNLVTKPGSSVTIKLMNNPPSNVLARDANIILGRSPSSK